tara:strand:- start:597 stop:1004 length:408 start_codon:yes stop_codon:yes gene_type:complete
MKQCNCCKESTLDYIIDAQDNIVCDECGIKDYCFCDECGEYVKTESCEVIEDRWDVSVVCDKCSLPIEVTKILNSLSLIPLDSVGCYIDTKSWIVYPCKGNKEIDLDNGVHLDDCTEEWLSEMSTSDLLILAHKL